MNLKYEFKNAWDFERKRKYYWTNYAIFSQLELTLDQD